MTTNRKNLSINSVEFEDIKTNFKTFLSGQDVFKDYDYEGSALATLIDLLAYNTYYQAFYNNIVANEMFLDSSVKRSSVVSHAKSIGYTPSSRSASTAIVDLVFGSTPSSTVLLPGSQFTTTINSQTYTFVNVDSAEIVNNDGVWSVTDLVIKEGTLTNVTYIVPDSNTTNKYEIPDQNVDTSTIKVRVQASQNDTTGLTDVWSRSTDITEIEPTSNVFFLEENTRQNYEIYFGDGVLGRKLEAGNLVTITYLTTNGSVANGVGNNETESNRSFLYLNNNNTVIVKSPSSGGAEKENIDVIRFRAPRSFISQNRAVTKDDYSSLIASNFSEFDSVFVYGGEEAEPPSYGSVFVALKPKIGTIVTSALKKQVESFLTRKAVLAVRPVIIDPNYTYLRFNFDVSYDTNKTSLTAPSLAQAIKRNVTQNISTNLGKFGQSFSISKLLTDVDSSSTSIDSSAVSVTMEKRFLATSSRVVSYNLDFGNPIYHPHDGHIPVISSNEFRYLNNEVGEIQNVFLEDDGFGNISFFQKKDDNTKVLVAANTGRVDYQRGRITLDRVQILSPTDITFIQVYAKANNKRYTSVRDMILINDYVNDLTSIQVTLNGIEQFVSTTIGTQNNSLSTFTSTFVG